MCTLSSMNVILDMLVSSSEWSIAVVEQPSLVYLYYCVRVSMSRTTLFLGGHM